MQYTTVEEAETYLQSRMNITAWDNANEDEKTRALSHAETIINRLNLSVDLTVLPVATRIKEAIIEIGLALLDGVDPEKEINNIYVNSRSFALQRTSYDRTFIPEHYQAGVPSAVAWQLLKPYLINNRNITLTRVT